MFYNVIRLCSGVGHFVAQANGAGNQELGAIWLNASIVCVFVFTFVVMVAWFCTEPVASAFGVNQELSKNTGYYSKVLAFSFYHLELL